MSPEETFRRVLAARLPAGPAWTAWIDGTAAELAASVDGITLVGREVNIAREALRFEVMWRSEHGYEGPLVDAPRALADRLEPR